MNHPEVKPQISPPLDESGVPIRLEIKLETPDRLRLTYVPDFFFTVFGLVVCVMLTVVFALIELIYALLTAFLFFFCVYVLIDRRRIDCVFDKQKGELHHVRSGVLGSGVDQCETAYTLDEISQVELKRIHHRGRDTFQIDLVLKNQTKLKLAYNTLTFSECMEAAEQLKNFFGENIPVKALE